MATEHTSSGKETVEELADACDSKFLKTLSEPVRIEILKFIMLNGRADIGTIADKMPQDRSVISRHLNLMHEVGILTCEKESRHIFYDINGQGFLGKLQNLTNLIQTCMEKCCPSCLK